MRVVTQKIKVGMRGIRVGMRGIGMENLEIQRMWEIRVGMGGIRVILFANLRVYCFG